MKKLTALIAALALLLSLCACSGQAGGPKGDNTSPEPGAASQSAGGDVSQDVKPDEEPPVTPVAETRSPAPSEEPQPSSSAPEASAPEPAPAPDPVPAKPPVSAPAPAPESAPVPAPDPEPVPAADPKITARGLIGHPVGELYAAVGQPISSDYAPGCLEPDSEDGELIYSGFTVYTVRTATREYVYDVL